MAPQAESFHLDVTSDFFFFQKEFILSEIETHLILCQFEKHTHCIDIQLYSIMSVEV